MRVPTAARGETWACLAVLSAAIPASATGWAVANGYMQFLNFGDGARLDAVSHVLYPAIAGSIAAELTGARASLAYQIRGGLARLWAGSLMVALGAAFVWIVGYGAAAGCGHPAWLVAGRNFAIAMLMSGIVGVVTRGSAFAAAGMAVAVLGLASGSNPSSSLLGVAFWNGSIEFDAPVIAVGCSLGPLLIVLGRSRAGLLN